MTRKRWLWLSATALLTVLVAYQAVITSTGDRTREFAARADVPTVQPGVDVLGGITVVPWRTRHYDYRRAAFGDAWTDDNDAPGGHNGCDTRFLGGFDVLRETLQEVGFKQGTLR